MVAVRSVRDDVLLHEVSALAAYILHSRGLDTGSGGALCGIAASEVLICESLTGSVPGRCSRGRHRRGDCLQEVPANQLNVGQIFREPQCMTVCSFGTMPRRGIPARWGGGGGLELRRVLPAPTAKTVPRSESRFTKGSLTLEPFCQTSDAPRPSPSALPPHQHHPSQRMEDAKEALDSLLGRDRKEPTLREQVAGRPASFWEPFEPHSRSPWSATP